MCLTVAKVPKSKQIIICKKSLQLDDGVFTSYFYGARVPKHGWLFPSNFSNVSIAYGDKVRGGYIHAYTKKKEEYYWNNYYRAYAFGVSAYNHTMTELVCRALYIPIADKTKLVGEYTDTEKIILGFSRYKRSEILKKLPILERVEKYL
jgi:hypothetical protein